MNGDIFETELEQLRVDCPEVQGAVLASCEGLLLAAMGCLQEELSAASAACLLTHVEQNLSLMRSTQCSELLIWASASVWYLGRVTEQSVLMVCAAPTCHSGAFRLSGRNVMRQLAVMLGPAD